MVPFAVLALVWKGRGTLRENKVAFEYGTQKRYMVPFAVLALFWKGRGAFERKKVAFKCGTQKRMETRTETGMIDRNSSSSLLTLS